jgi:hypothetical protein
MKNRNFTKKYTDRKTINSKLCEVWSELAEGFSIYSATYEKSPTIWWIKSHNSGMKNWNVTKKYTDHQTINCFYTPVFKTGCIMVYQCPTVRPSVRPFHMWRSNLRTPWPFHFKFHRVIGMDGVTVCILYGEISNFHSRIMGPISNAKFEVNWQRGSQFTAWHTKNCLKIMYNLMNKVP